MIRMNRRERALKALDIRAPDKVPIFELEIDPPHIETIIGRKIVMHGRGEIFPENLMKKNIEATVDCYNKLGFALIGASPFAPSNFKAKILPDRSMIDEWGMAVQLDPRSGIWVYKAGSLKSEEYYNEWLSTSGFPDPHAPGRMDYLKYLIKKVNGKMAVFGSIKCIYSVETVGLDFGVFNRMIMERSTFVRRLLEQLSDYNIELIKIMADIGVDLIICDGDIADAHGPMMAQRYFEELVYPNMRREVDVAHKMGLKYVKHTDGYVTPLIEGLVNKVGIDGLHSLDPSADVDIRAIKREYGDRIILMGNVSTDHLALGSKEEIIRETKECMKEAAPRGGYFLSSSNTWYYNTKLENCLAMVETGKKYGKYPIHID